MSEAMRAGMIENNAQIISRTDSSFVMVTTVLPASSVPEINPDKPSSKATKEPEIAVPNFCDIVPDEKMRPVDEVPFFSVA